MLWLNIFFTAFFLYLALHGERECKPEIAVPSFILAIMNVVLIVKQLL